MKLFGLFVISAGLFGVFGAQATVHLVQRPTMNKTQIVFSYAGDLWTVSRQGGKAERLTAGVGFETEAEFSPDGNTLAFTGEYDGNIDVFTMPAAGGTPKRITYHPDPDRLVGWSPDGKGLLFRSNRDSYSRFTQLFSVSTEGGMPEVLPLPWPAPEPIRRMASAWSTLRWTAANSLRDLRISSPGSDIAEARPAISGS
jgi:tricorn protease